MAKKTVDVKADLKKAKKAGKKVVEKVEKASKSAGKKGDKRVKELQATITKLEATIERLESKVDDWKGQAKKHQAKRAELKKALQDAQRKPAGGAAGPDTPLAEVPAAAASPAAATADDSVEVPAAPAGSSAAETPDASWTIVRLRGLARERGVAGYSRKTKAQLIEALS